MGVLFGLCVSKITKPQDTETRHCTYLTKTQKPVERDLDRAGIGFSRNLPSSYTHAKPACKQWLNELSPLAMSRPGLLGYSVIRRKRFILDLYLQIISPQTKLNSTVWSKSPPDSACSLSLYLTHTASLTQGCSDLPYQVVS
ncbi:hypothetical protein RRG08_032404, partial [Elysia crispata]